MNSGESNQTPSLERKDESKQSPAYVANDGSETSPEDGHEAGGGSDDTGPGPNGS